VLDVLVLALDDALLALPLARVVEASRRVSITPLPSAPDVVLGMIVHRGEPIAAVDLRTRLGLALRAPRLTDQMVIARTQRRTVALVVDRVVGTSTLAAERVRPTLSQAPHIAGVAVVDDGLWMIEDLDAVLSLDEERVLDRALGVSP
jgi:purine-binding chemotaxis protein CheW